MNSSTHLQKIPIPPAVSSFKALFQVFRASRPVARPDSRPAWTFVRLKWEVKVEANRDLQIEAEA